MRLALCIITKGDSELENLKRAVDSTNGVCKDVYITANHTHTKTEAWCKKQGYHFSYLKWDNNFSQQRNFNFSQVEGDVDYIVWMDCDDVIVNPHILEDIARIGLKNGHDCIFFEYWYGALFDGKPSIDTYIETEIKHNRERLIKPHKMVWKKRIHENPEPIDPDNFKYTRIAYSDEFPITWLHLGAERNISDERMAKRLARNRTLLELELEDERKEGQADPRTLLYLMKILTESDDEKDLRDCIEMGDEYMQRSGWDQERATCCQLMARCYGELDEDSKAVALLHKAIIEYPNDISLYLHLARGYYNLGKYREMKHWLDVAMKMEIEEGSSAMTNILEIKMLTAELQLLYNLNVKKSIRKALTFAKKLYELNPSKENRENLEYITKQEELDHACEGMHKYMLYLVKTQQESLIESVYKDLPKEMKALPFAVKMVNKYGTPKNWGKKTIVYYATFGRPHFEKWDGNSIKKGIGGSETAVIRLSEEWAKNGYEVVVFCDCTEMKTINDVTYAPYYMFNTRDFYNILITWRHSGLAGKVKARKMLVDLHDLYHESSHMGVIDGIDHIMVKSKFHKELAPNIKNEKFEVVSNGI